MDEWRAAVKPIQEQWVKKMEAKGLPGIQVYDKALELAKKYVKLDRNKRWGRVKSSVRI
jgi:hypothetical protein